MFDTYNKIKANRMFYSTQKQHFITTSKRINPVKPGKAFSKEFHLLQWVEEITEKEGTHLKQESFRIFQIITS